MAQLNGTQYQALTKALMLGFSIDPTTFFILLNQAKNIIETDGSNWEVLKGVKNSDVATPSTTFQSPFILPADFLEPQSERPMVLVAQSGANNTDNYLDYLPVPISDQYVNQDQSYRFWIDYAANKYYLGGTVSQNYIINFNYIISSADITASTVWPNFPQWANPILAWDVANMYKGGVDYDVVNKASVQSGIPTRDKLYQRLLLWNARIAAQNREGMDPRYDNAVRPQAGHIDIYGL